MQHDLYQMPYPDDVAPILEEMRQNIADRKPMGVTLVGNRLTLRWNRKVRGKQPEGVDVHMVILYVQNEESEEDFHRRTCSDGDK